MSILDKLKGKKSEEADDGGYKFSLAKGLQKRSASEADEDRYLAEKESKDLSEKRIIQNRIRKQELKDVGRAAAGAAFSGLVTIGEGAVATGRYVGSTQIAQYAGTKAKGAVEWIPSKFEKARLDYEAGKISQKKYDEAYRQAKIERAKIRGEGSELRHYRAKVGKEVDRENLAQARKEIAISAEKAYYTERAKTSGRIAARQAKQQEQAARQQYVVVGQPPRRRRQWPGPVWQQSPYRQPTAEELDPMGIYTLRPSQQTNPQARQPQSRPQQAPVGADISKFVNNFLNLNAPQSQAKNTQPKKKKEWKLNIFSGQMEWV